MIKLCLILVIVLAQSGSLTETKSRDKEDKELEIPKRPTYPCKLRLLAGSKVDFNDDGCIGSYPVNECSGDCHSEMILKTFESNP